MDTEVGYVDANINKNQVSFVVDEDFRNRTYSCEEVGYFAFERVMLPIDKCDYFPEMLQSKIVIA
ncbi:hypothetical protein O9992_11065 [Vibrio lentus]|nr:hypothetical protein [Vibrio lentus]